MKNTLNPELSMLQSSLSYLMTRYARTGSTQVASAVIHHLSMILEHPDLSLYSGGNEIYRAMLLQWRDLKSKSTNIPVFEKPVAHLH